MTFDETLSAARWLARHWQGGQHLDELPASCRPATPDEARAVQALWPRVVEDRIAGWKIAATSKAGQEHIQVGGPIAGPIFWRHVHHDGALVSLAHNGMKVAECEIVFRIDRTLAPRPEPYARAEVMVAVGALMPGIEVPDSRFRHFERVGEAQLIADCACMNDMLVGRPVTPGPQVDELPALLVQARVSDGRTPQGHGHNVLGDPVEALVWLVNELRASGRTLVAGQFVTTGACVPPIPVRPGDRVEADFGWIGRISVRFV